MREALQRFGDKNDQVATWFHNMKDVVLHYNGGRSRIRSGRELPYAKDSGVLLRK
jgi:hypothetical protein